MVKWKIIELGDTPRIDSPKPAMLADDELVAIRILLLEHMGSPMDWRNVFWRAYVGIDAISRVAMKRMAGVDA